MRTLEKSEGYRKFNRRIAAAVGAAALAIPAALTAAAYTDPTTYPKYGTLGACAKYDYYRTIEGPVSSHLVTIFLQGDSSGNGDKAIEIQNGKVAVGDGNTTTGAVTNLSTFEKHAPGDLLLQWGLQSVYAGNYDNGWKYPAVDRLTNTASNDVTALFEVCSRATVFDFGGLLDVENSATVPWNAFNINTMTPRPTASQ